MLRHCQAYELQVYGLQVSKTKTKQEAKIKNKENKNESRERNGKKIH